MRCFSQCNVHNSLQWLKSWRRWSRPLRARLPRDRRISLRLLRYPPHNQHSLSAASHPHSLFILKHRTHKPRAADSSPHNRQRHSPHNKYSPEWISTPSTMTLKSSMIPSGNAASKIQGIAVVWLSRSPANPHSLVEEGEEEEPLSQRLPLRDRLHNHSNSSPRRNNRRVCGHLHNKDHPTHLDLNHP